MASRISLLSSILLLILFHVIDPTSRVASTSIPKQTGFRATLTRASLPKNRRILNELGPGLTSTLNANDDEYTMNINIGTPPVVFKAVMDTGSDLIWAKCSNVNYTFNRTSSFSSTSSSENTTFSPNSPSSTVSMTSHSSYSKHKYYHSSYSPTKTSSFSFNPLSSQSFSPVTEPCENFNLSEDCKMSYADKTAISFFMAHETLTMDTTTMGVIFACVVPEEGNMLDGIIGMGRGKVSLLSQLNERVFGYCLPSRLGGGGDDESKKGVFVMGSAARILIGNDDTIIQRTPLLRNNKQSCESRYCVSLEGISVGETRLNVTRSEFALSMDQSGGMVVDSGATFTLLEDRIVGMIKDEFLKQTRLEKSEVYEAPYKFLDLCFDKNDVVAIVLPKLVFHFEGADWEMSGENYIYEDGSHPQSCFAIISYGDDKTSVLGNIQQQNMMVVYDLDGNSLSFKPAKCNEL